MRSDVFPLVTKSLERTSFVDYTLRKNVLLGVADSKGYYQPLEHIVLNISFDAKTCVKPISSCCAECEKCLYNPLSHLFDSDYYGEPLIITSRYTIKALLDAITLLATANTNALMQMEHMKANYDKANLLSLNP